MNVKVDGAGKHDEAAGVNDVVTGEFVPRDRCDAAASNADVCDNTPGWRDHMAAAHDKVVDHAEIASALRRIPLSQFLRINALPGKIKRQ